MATLAQRMCGWTTDLDAFTVAGLQMRPGCQACLNAGDQRILATAEKHARRGANRVYLALACSRQTWPLLSPHQHSMGLQYSSADDGPTCDGIADSRACKLWPRLVHQLTALVCMHNVRECVGFRVSWPAFSHPAQCRQGSGSCLPLMLCRPACNSVLATTTMPGGCCLRPMLPAPITWGQEAPPAHDSWVPAEYADSAWVC